MPNFENERRSSIRQRVFKGGILFFDKYSKSVECIIKNESDSGAKIEVDPNIFLPLHLTLINKKDATIVETNLIWRQGKLLGLIYSGTRESLNDIDKKDFRHKLVLSLRC